MRGKSVCALAVSLAVTLFSGSAATAVEFKDVRVVNSSEEPVPVEGAVFVANSTADPLPVEGAVRVDSSEEMPVLVREVGGSGRRLVSYPLNVDMTDLDWYPPGGADWDSLNFLPLESGEHLVVEAINVQAESGIGRLAVWLQAIPPDRPPWYADDTVSVPIEEQASGMYGAFVNARWYVESGYRILPKVYHEGGSGEARVRLVIVGYIAPGCGHIYGLEGDPACFGP